MQIQIRPITKEDFRGFHDCLDAVARERKYLGFVEAPALEATREWLLADLEKGVIRLVALDGERVVGWCDVVGGQRAGFTHAGRLGMGVLKEYRRMGIGKLLLEETLSMARARGLERVELDVYSSNTPAIRLYERLNFQVEGRKHMARKLDGTYDDILVMAVLFDG